MYYYLWHIFYICFFDDVITTSVDVFSQKEIKKRVDKKSTPGGVIIKRSLLKLYQLLPGLL